MTKSDRDEITAAKGLCSPRTAADFLWPARRGAPNVRGSQVRSPSAPPWRLKTRETLRISPAYALMKSAPLTAVE
jgi:hypothetical protein